MGLWRYSMALVIVLAAMLDVVWWVPAHDPSAARDEPAMQQTTRPVRATTPRCRRAQIERQIRALEAELADLPAR